MTLRAAWRGRFRLDADALDGLYRSHAQALLVFFTRRLFDAEAAVDLVAETFATAFQSRRGFRGTTEEEAVGFLYGIARNKLLAHIHTDAMRAEKSRLVPLERRAMTDAEIDRIEELAGLEMLRHTVCDELGALSPEHRAALRLRIVEELDYDEVAARLKVTEQAARARVSRGLKALASRLPAHSDLS